jgi:hypothetical protein
MTKEELDLLFEYDYNSGKLIWKVDRGACSRNGKVAGFIGSDGYISIEINNKAYKAHRLIWIMIYGKLPNDKVDHINGIRHDNRLCNLRECSHYENMRNRYKNSNNKSGYKGVSWSKDKQKWLVQLMVNKNRIHVGLFNDINDAAEAYKLAAIKYHGDFAKFN